MHQQCLFLSPRVFLLCAIATMTQSCGLESSSKKISRSYFTDTATERPKSPQAASLTSLEAFEKTLYPILKKNCQACHGQVISPFFASSDVKTAHDALLNTKKVDLGDVAGSRLISRLASDKHNCWSGDCEADAKEIEGAISGWSSAVADNKDKPSMLLSEARAANGVTKQTVGLGAGTIVLEAESGTLRAPMRADTDTLASGGRYVSVPNNLNDTLAANAANAGSVQFSVNVEVPGTYKVWGRAMAPNLNDRSFYISVNSATPSAWLLPINAPWTWDAASTDNAARDLTFNLGKGRHTIVISQRQDGTRLDRLVVTDDMNFNGSSFTRQADLLTFDLSKLLDADAGTIQLELANFNATTYKINNLRLVDNKRPVTIRGIYVLMNDKLDPQHATYSKVDVTIPAGGGLISAAALIMAHDQGPAADQLRIGFDEIK